MKRRSSFLLIGLAWGVLAYLYVPIVTLLVYSFNANPQSMTVWSGFTFDWYLRVFENLGITSADRELIGQENRDIYSDPRMIGSVMNTVVVGLTASLTALLVALPTALGLRRWRTKAKPLIIGFMILPIVLPDTVLGLSLLILFATVGLPLGTLSVALGHSVFLFSLSLVVLLNAARSIDDRLEEASADLGASRWRTFRSITLPLLRPGIVGAFLLSFVVSLDDLVVAFFTSGVGGTTLPVYIFGAIRRGVSPEINAIAVLMILTSVILIGLVALLFRASRSNHTS